MQAMRRLFSILCLLTFGLGSWPRAQAAPARADEIEGLLASMTTKQKVGQLFMVSLYGRELTRAGEDFIRDYQPGAVSLFSYNTDYQPASEVARLINAMQSRAVASGAGIPLLLAVDHEGGEVRRIVNGVTRFPDPTHLGALTDLRLMQAMGRVTGAELAALGIHMNLAPVADLYTREDLFDKNRVLHRRTLGDDPERVGLLAWAYSAGLAESGVAGVMKHFPGHGGAEDSHKRLPILDLDAESARRTALRPFEVALAQDPPPPAVMVGHLYYPSLEPSPNLPASLSPTLIQGLLREEWGYEGVIMTDALDMAAVPLPIPEAGLAAFLAGADMLVLGPNVSWGTQQAAIETLRTAVADGRVSMGRLDASVRRILTLKAAHGGLTWAETDPASVASRIDLEASAKALLESYLGSATLLHDESALVPVAPDDSLAVIYPAPFVEVYTACSALAPNVAYYGYTLFPTSYDYNSIANLATRYETLVLFVADVHKNPNQAALARHLPAERTILISLSSPYDVEFFPEVSSFIALYSDHPASREAACRVLFGASPLRGRSPFPVGGYPSGTGLMRP